MAPSKTSRTPKPVSKASNPRTPITKKRESLTNKSILNFFQKVPKPEDSMFVGDVGAIVGKPPIAKQEEDIYGDDGQVLEERYNEAQVSSKRRKLSDAGEGKTKTAALEAEAKSTPPAKVTPSARPAKKPRRGPFLDDSDSEDDDEPPTKPLEDTKSERPPPEEPQPKEDQEVWTATPKPDSVTTSLTPASEPVSMTKPIPPLIKQETSTNGDHGDFEGLDDFDDELFEGEELREMRFIKEQARLEAEEAGNYSCDDGFETLMEDDGMTETCPMCSASLAGVTPDQATRHVNSCLDGNPIPLPKPIKVPSPPQVKGGEKENKHEMVSAPEVGKRFARAAVARPGQANPISLDDSNNTGTGSGSAFSKLMSGHAEDAAWATAAATEHSSRGRPAYERTCPFYKIMPGFFICVDAFRYGAVEGCRAYFLSHFHSDHYIGLTANWTHGPIYCSKVTGSLVKSQLKTAEKYVVELDFDRKVPVPGTEGVMVTMISANHCPGSSLFLFEKVLSSPNAHANSKEKRVQRILHCGDFRACPAHIKHPQLKPETTDALGKIKQQKIDVCYLDTTYLNPRYSFPPQNDVIKSCADLCLELDKSLRAENEAEWNSVLRRREGKGAAGNDTVTRFFTAADKSEEDDKPTPKETDTPSAPPTAFTALGQLARQNRNRLLVVCGTYSIGKERICKAIAQALNTKIFASPSKIRICSQLGDPELTALMTPNPHEAQVHMQMLMELRAETLAEYLDHYKPHFGRVVGFRPSGWNYRPTMVNSGGKVAAAAAGANTPPASVPTTQILHGPAWRTRFGARDLVPQQGSSKDALCFGVPYSEHSSFRELALFVMSLRIEKIVPTVNVGSEPSRRRMKGWTDRWLSERRRGGVTRLLEGEEPSEADVKATEKGGKGKDAVGMWEGKDGRGGGVYW